MKTLADKLWQENGGAYAPVITSHGYKTDGMELTEVVLSRLARPEPLTLKRSLHGRSESGVSPLLCVWHTVCNTVASRVCLFCP